ncbi:MAG TPA: hypothetical protein PKE39_00345 [Ignavibacteria bacterium]|nr:hypothetical protein [Ignavibacteria bacterium]HMQ97444.1 hypothetical protein [Ignavibacteria bacterium]
MTGINFVINEKGKKSAVVIDLKKHGKLWEDFYDALKVRQRKNEPRETLQMVKDKLKRSTK